MLDWLWQGVLTDWLARTLIFGVGALVVFLKAKKPEWVSPIMSGLAAAGLMAVILIGIRGYAHLKMGTPITPENVEQAVRSWVDTFGYGIQKVNNEKSHFAFTITLVGGHKVSVQREKGFDQHLKLSGSLSVAKKDQEFFANLPKDKAQEFRRDLKIEMLRFKIPYTIIGSPFQRITIDRYIPIARELTEYNFVTALNEVKLARLLAEETIIRRLQPMRSSQ